MLLLKCHFPTQASSGKTWRPGGKPGEVERSTGSTSLESSRWFLLSPRCGHFPSAHCGRSGALLCTADASIQACLHETLSYSKQAETKAAVLEQICLPNRSVAAQRGRIYNFWSLRQALTQRACIFFVRERSPPLGHVGTTAALRQVVANTVMCRDIISKVGRAAVGRWEPKRLYLLWGSLLYILAWKFKAACDEWTYTSVHHLNSKWWHLCPWLGYRVVGPSL